MSKIIAKKGFLFDGRISPSQLKTWVKSPKQYIRQYVQGEPMPTSKYMEFGSWIHSQIENGRSENPTLDMMIALIPRLDVPEQKIEVETEVAKTKVILNGIIDSYAVDEDYIIDYKTGKAGNWDDEIVASDLQFKFYALMHKLITKRDLKKVVVVHLITEETENGSVVLTGDFEEYEYIPSKEDLKHVTDTFKKFLDWTSTLTEDMLKTDVNKEIEDVITVMSEIKKKIEEFETEYDNLKAIVLADMEKTGALEVKTDQGHVYFTTRRSWELPPEVKKLEKVFKTAKEKYEDTHEPTKITKILTFKAK